MILWFMMIYDNICMRHTHENIKKYCSIGGLQMIRFDEVDICPGLTWRRGQPCLLLVSMRILIVQHPRWIKAHNITQSTSKYSILYKQKTRTHTHKHQLSPYLKKHICISIVYAVYSYLWTCESWNWDTPVRTNSLAVYCCDLKLCIVDLFMSLQLYVKRTVHHQLPNVLAVWSKATSLSLVRMALSASQKQNRSSGFSNASQTFRCPQSALAFVEHLDTKHCGSCTTYPGTCGKKSIIGGLSDKMDVLLAIHHQLSVPYLASISEAFLTQPCPPNKNPSWNVSSKGKHPAFPNLCLKQYAATSQIHDVPRITPEMTSSSSHTYQDFLMKTHNLTTPPSPCGRFGPSFSHPFSTTAAKVQRERWPERDKSKVFQEAAVEFV